MKRMSKSRTLDMALMLAGAVLLLVGVPFGLYLSQTWADNIPLSWSQIDEGDLFEGDVENVGWTPPDPMNVSGPIYVSHILHGIGVGWPTHWTYSPYWTWNETSVLWDLNENSTDAVIVDDNLTAGIGGKIVEKYWARIYWILDLNASDLSSNDIWKVKYDLDYNGSYNLGLGLAPTDINGLVTLQGSEVLWTGSGNGSEYGIISYDLLDVLAGQSELGQGKLIFWIEVEEGDFQTGDIVLFRLWTQKPTSGLISQKNVTQIVLVVLTGILGFVALASTPLWNPLNKKDPGIVGRVGRSVGSWIGRRSRKRRRTRR